MIARILPAPGYKEFGSPAKYREHVLGPIDGLLPPEIEDGLKRIAEDARRQFGCQGANDLMLELRTILIFIDEEAIVRRFEDTVDGTAFYQCRCRPIDCAPIVIIFWFLAGQAGPLWK